MKLSGIRSQIYNKKKMVIISHLFCLSKGDILQYIVYSEYIKYLKIYKVYVFSGTIKIKMMEKEMGK